MEILQHLASVGSTKPSLMKNKLMPLENITGKMLQQIEENITERSVSILIALKHVCLFTSLIFYRWKSFLLVALLAHDFSSQKGSFA